MTCDDVKRHLTEFGYPVKTVRYIPEGANNAVFEVQLMSNEELICKFPRTKHIENDTLFDGPLSPERERYIYTLARTKGGIPAPRVYGLHTCGDSHCLVVEKMAGMSFSKWLRQRQFSKAAFLQAMQALGADFARLHAVTFESFGDVMPHGIAPENIENFCDRFSGIVSKRLRKAFNKLALTPHEYRFLQSFFTEQFDRYHTYYDATLKPPTFVLTDMHADNFFVDTTGRPSGYFDLESAQAAPAELEFYGLRFFIFNYFDAQTAIEAESTFFQSYQSCGGPYAPKSDRDAAFIDLLSACRLLELTESYWGHQDGLRDTWGIRMKRLLLDYTTAGVLNYSDIADIFREKTQQPRTPQNI